jgi:hypothetical protein
LCNTEWNPIESHVFTKLGCWQVKLLSYGDRQVLINFFLTSLQMLVLSFLEIPKGVRKILDLFQLRFFWKSDDTKKKYGLAK